MTEAGPEGIQAAVTIVAMIPIMAVYPFIQKYFTRGIMIGSIKG
jgi:putative aldouronate transport system permease protein